MEAVGINLTTLLLWLLGLLLLIAGGTAVALLIYGIFFKKRG
jgi:hypothetical protein